MLARQQEIENLDKQLRAHKMLADEARARAVRAEAALTQATQRLQELRQRANGLTQAVHGLQIDVMKLSEVQERFNQRSAQIEVDLAEIAQHESEQQQAKAESEAKFEQLDMELAELQQRHEDGQTDYLAKEQQLNDARGRLRELERAAQEAEFAEKSHRNKIDELKRSIATALEQAAQLFANMQQGHLELESLDDQTAQAGLQSLLDKRSEQERALADARHELDQLTQKLRQHEESRMQAERSLQPQRDRIMELQLKEQAARLNQEQYAQQLLEAQADEEELAAKLNGDMRPSYLQGEVTRLTNAIAALGAVNLAALDELAQASERKNFLDAQNADLTEAINTLQDAIHKIDRETRDLLQDTFDKVNQHFAELFPILFGGGNAKLIMTGDEILDSGVQVMAQPPGKKNATIHLLVGRREGADRDRAGVFDVPAESGAVLPAGRGRCAAGRRQYRAFLQHGQAHVREHAVPVHLAQQDRDGNGAAVDWRHHAGAGRVAHRRRGHGIGGDAGDRGAGGLDAARGWLAVGGLQMRAERASAACFW